jgi:muconolactone delta-isomerase
MKFLVLVKHREGTAPLEDPVAARKAAREGIKAALADGRMDCAYQFASGRRAVSILNAESAEEVWERLTSYPLYSLQDYEVHPLVDVDYIFSRVLERMKEAAGG